MKNLILSTIAAACLAAGCATVESSSESASAAKTAKEDYVTGSRLPRSESSENYQGSKAMTGRDYQDYKNSTSLKGGN
jgi:hypothetical protein